MRSLECKQSILSSVNSRVNLHASCVANRLQDDVNPNMMVSHHATHIVDVLKRLKRVRPSCIFRIKKL